MSIQTIGNRLVTLLREGKFESIYDELFDAERVRHIEPQSPHFPEVVGVTAIKAKDAAMSEGIAGVNSMTVGDPIFSKDYFAIPYQISLALKDGQEMQLDEIILYQVENGKIVLEQFFY